MPWFTRFIRKVLAVKILLYGNFCFFLTLYEALESGLSKATCVIQQLIWHWPFAFAFVFNLNNFDKVDNSNLKSCAFVPLSIIIFIIICYLLSIISYLFGANISSSMVFNGSDRLMVVCAICRMCTQLAMIHFSKEKLFISQKLLQQTQHTTLYCRRAVLF